MMNNTEKFPSGTDLITMGFNIAFGCSAVVLNSILLLVLYRDPLNKFRTPSTVLVTNLAIADALTGLFVMTRTILMLQEDFNPIGFGFILYFTLWAMQCSFFTVLFIAWERLFAVTYPLRFRNYVTKVHMFLLSLAGWLISFVLSNLPLIAGDSAGKLIFLTFGILNFVITCFIVTAYYFIYKVLKRKQLEMERYGDPCDTPRRNIGSLGRKRSALSENKRLINTFLVITVILLLTGFPMMVLMSTVALCSTKCSIAAYKILLTYEPLLMLNFIVNPLVYAFQLPTYRQAFLTVFRCTKQSNVIQPEMNA